jgi:hypothetical protein
MERTSFRKVPGVIDFNTEPLWTVPGFFSPEECARWIELAFASAPERASVNLPGGPVVDDRLRNNTRVIRDDLEAAVALTERVRPHVPATMWEGQWAFAGVNERLRIYLYEPGQYFKPHYDGCWAPNDDERSWLTFMIYLNTPDAGGQTRFLDMDTDVEAREGSALFFQHRLLHEGAEVTAGAKYALRTDVMYRRA